MDQSGKLQDHGKIIEGALCAFDHSTDRKITDEAVLRILERLIDKYHFNDVVHIDDHTVKIGFEHVDREIESKLSDLPAEKLVKLIGVIYSSVRRRAGQRTYLDFIHQFVGVAFGAEMHGARIRNIPGVGQVVTNL